jgi:hypothetical protein
VAYTPTCDPYVVIESQTPTSVINLVPRTGEKWRIDGVCSRCGECWQGSTSPKPVLDDPVRPGIGKNNPSCTLTGVYLVGPFRS